MTCSIATIAIILCAVTASASDTNGPVKRVLMLHSFGREFAPFNVMSATFRAELARQSTVPVEFHEASIETARFEEGVREEPLAGYLFTLFERRRLDLIVTMGGPATLFINRHRDRLFSDVPVLATMDVRRVKEVGVVTNMTFVPLQLNLPATIEDILQILPATTNIVMVLGAAPFERYWADECRREFAAFTHRIAFTYLNDLSLEEMRKTVATLPPNSVVYYGTLVMDAAGVPHEQEAALSILRASANAPIFGVFSHQLGLGIIGGRLTSNEEWGRRAAEAARRILNGEPSGTVIIPPTVPDAPAYDWRELRRWGVSESRLPPGSEVRFREPTQWEQYKWQIIGGIAVCAVEAALIVALLIQLRRRKRAEGERQQAQDGLAHLARVSTVNQLTVTLAHELNQPLGAILRNAEAAELFLQHNPPDYEEVRAILADIRQDDQRAAAVIDRVRALLKRQGLKLETLSLPELIHDVVNLTHAQMLTRGVMVQVELAADLPLVQGDRVQLQQVLLNLFINAADAMSALPPERRQLFVRARANGQRIIEVSVSDAGPGIRADRLPRLFEAFFTTKPDGMGMGLAICETIVKSHGGRIWATNNPECGATVRFTLNGGPA